MVRTKLLWRMPRRRLELEAMRDSMLAVSGELKTSMGGRPFDLDSDPIVPRRSVYAFVNRDIVSKLASTFDGANPNACTATRPETTVPQQALYALNSEFIQDRATALASHPLVAQAKTNENKIRVIFQRAYSREPTDEELKLAIEYLKTATNESDDAEAAQDTALKRFAHVLLAANEFVFVD